MIDTLLTLLVLGVLMAAIDFGTAIIARAIETLSTAVESIDTTLRETAMEK